MLPNLPKTINQPPHTYFEQKKGWGDNSKCKFEHRPDLININSESIQFR